MHPTLFQFGPLSLHSYGLLVALGFLAGILLTVYFARREGIAAEKILDLSVYVILSSIIGARFFYVAGQWDLYKNNPFEILAIHRGGLVFLGGLIFSAAAVVLYARLKQISLLKLMDAIGPGAALGYAIGRIGCFLNGCCFGNPTTLSWGIIFPPPSLAGNYFSDTPLHPTQLISSLAMLLVFLILIWLYRAKRFDGQISSWFFILYASYRFAVEFLRYSPLHWLGLTPSQWLAFALFSWGIWGLSYYRQRV